MPRNYAGFSSYPTRVLRYIQNSNLGLVNPLFVSFKGVVIDIHCDYFLTALVSFRRSVRNLLCSYFLTCYEDSSALPLNDMLKVSLNDILWQSLRFFAGMEHLGAVPYTTNQYIKVFFSE